METPLVSLSFPSHAQHVVERNIISKKPKQTGYLSFTSQIPIIISRKFIVVKNCLRGYGWLSDRVLAQDEQGPS